jgi:hypothetical protein
MQDNFKQHVSNLRLSQERSSQLWFSGLCHCVVLQVVTNISEKHVASVLKEGGLLFQNLQEYLTSHRIQKTTVAGILKYVVHLSSVYGAFPSCGCRRLRVAANKLNKLS